jgi:transcriptional regulator
MDTIYKKENSIRHVHEKISKAKKTLDSYEEENKKISSRIEKEEAEGERLRHILNFLLSQRD